MKGRGKEAWTWRGYRRAVSLRAASTTAQQQSSVIVKVENVVPKMSFVANIGKDFSDGVVSVLAEEDVDTLPALFSASREDIEGLKTKKGYIALVRGGGWGQVCYSPNMARDLFV